jgi:hypothetical protein
VANVVKNGFQERRVKSVAVSTPTPRSYQGIRIFAVTVTSLRLSALSAEVFPSTLCQSLMSLADRMLAREIYPEVTMSSLLIRIFHDLL